MYSLDIINLFISKVNEGLSKKNISKLLNVSIKTIYNWNILYIDYIKSNTYLTKNTTSKHVHGLNKQIKYCDYIKTYVNEHDGCTLNDIAINATNNMLSKSTKIELLFLMIKPMMTF